MASENDDPPKPENPDETPLSTDDDGWGEAAESENPEATAPLVEDPTHLDERVAELHQQHDAAAAELPEIGKPSQDAPSISGRLAQPTMGIAPLPPTVADDDDAPQWGPENEELPPPSSDMLAAAGIHKQAQDKSSTKPPRSRRPWNLSGRQVGALLGITGLVILIGAFSIAGWFNQQNYYLVCGTDTIRAEQGDFWPWGQSNIPGARFRPIPVPGEVLCENVHFDSAEELEEAFLAALLDRTTAMLTSGDAETVEVAQGQIEQLLLLTRAPERRAHRQTAQRLRGDVSYWRAFASIQQAKKLLLESAKQFDDAATRRPRHSTDAHSWAQYARRLGQELAVGPEELRDTPEAKARPSYEPVKSPLRAPTDAGPSAHPGADAGATAPFIPAPDAAPPPPPDAGLPQGGVLL